MTAAVVVGRIIFGACASLIVVLCLACVMDPKEGFWTTAIDGRRRDFIPVVGLLAIALFVSWLVGGAVWDAIPWA